MKKIVTLIIFCVFCFVGAQQVDASEQTAYFTVEKFSIGQGYLIEPTSIAFSEGETVAEVFDRLMTNNGYTYKSTGKLYLGGSFYLKSINNADSGILNIPKCIQNMAPLKSWSGSGMTTPPNNKNNTGNKKSPNLGEFAYSDDSGWYFAVNGEAPSVGFSGITLKNDDIVRIQFTVYGLGADLGYGDNGLNHPARESVTQKMAIMNSYPRFKENETWKNAYNKAVSIVSNLDSTEEQILNVEKSLPTASQIKKWVEAKDKAAALKKKYTPAKTTLKSVKTAGSKKAKLTWKKVSAATGYEIYRSTKKTSGYKKIKTIKKAKTVTYKATGLKKKKTYYFKIRTYRKVGKTTYYGAYSNVKKIKAK